jgi:hypothetical protein
MHGRDHIPVLSTKGFGVSGARWLRYLFDLIKDDTVFSWLLRVCPCAIVSFYLRDWLAIFITHTSYNPYLVNTAFSSAFLPSLILCMCT